jgi:hypothetical protein
VYGNGECHNLFGVFHSEELGSECQVSTTAHRKIFCETLKNAHDKGLKPIHLLNEELRMKN